MFNEHGRFLVLDMCWTPSRYAKVRISVYEHTLAHVHTFCVYINAKNPCATKNCRNGFRGICIGVSAVVIVVGRCVCPCAAFVIRTFIPGRQSTVINKHTPEQEYEVSHINTSIIFILFKHSTITTLHW